MVQRLMQPSIGIPT